MVDETKDFESLPKLVQRAVATAKVLFVAFAAPVRAMYDIIQNAMLTAATVIGIIALVIYAGWELQHGDSYDDVQQSVVAINLERVRSMKISNNRADPESQLGNFAALTANVQNNGATDGLLVSFQPVNGALWYTLSWEMPHNKRNLIKLTSTETDSGGFIRVFVPAADFKIGTAPVWPAISAEGATVSVPISLYIYASNDMSSIRSPRQHVRTN